VRSEGPDDTERIAAELTATLAPGDVVLVSGELGTGKTTFVRGACRALGVTEPVTSPTFTIGQRYAAPIPVTHLDLYRLGELGGVAGEEPGFLDDYLTADAIAFVEWPSVGPELFDAPAATVEITHAGGDRREIEITR
jgi:tRNA threonylcarbamoyladenosine biosynthesis protein TsaE